ICSPSTRFSRSPSRNLWLTPALEKKPRQRCSPGPTLFSNPAGSFHPHPIFQTRINLSNNPTQASNPVQSFKHGAIFQIPLKTVILERSRPIFSSSFAPAKEAVCEVEESLFDPS